jgi:organic hydroperoxide reductase OsmC/OhrA
MVEPVEYDGPGDAWSPEHALLASVQACFLFTLRSVARLSKTEFARLELDAEGTVDRHDGSTRFVEIILKPRLTVAPGTDRTRALGILEKAKKACLVSSSLSTPIRLEAEVTEA